MKPLNNILIRPLEKSNLIAFSKSHMPFIAQ